MALLVALLLTVGVSTSSARVTRSADTKLTLVAFSTPREAYAKLIPAFQATSAGEGVTFDQSYGASEAQAQAIIDGLPADVVELSLEPDMTKLVRAGFVNPNWKSNAYKGVITRSVVVLVVRKGNPKGIRDWADLVQPGVEVITPNVAVSGGAKWNVMAAYGAQLKAGKTPAQALAYLRQLYGHVVVQDKSARDALNTFVNGKGDVLITYENEALTARFKGAPIQWIIPRATIKIENPIAVIQKSPNRAAADAFVKWLYTPEAQTLFGGSFYRPVVRSVLPKFNFPVRPDLFTIDYLGGWSAVHDRFFAPQTGIVSKIQQSLGQSAG